MSSFENNFESTHGSERSNLSSFNFGEQSLNSFNSAIQAHRGNDRTALNGFPDAGSLLQDLNSNGNEQQVQGDAGNRNRDENQPQAGEPDKLDRSEIEDPGWTRALPGQEGSRDLWRQYTPEGLRQSLERSASGNREVGDSKVLDRLREAPWERSPYRPPNYPQR